MNVFNGKNEFSPSPSDCADHHSSNRTASSADVLFVGIGEEIYGFLPESSGLDIEALKLNGGDLAADLWPTVRSEAEWGIREGVVRRQRKTRELEDLPPFLSTLDKISGRPRYILVTKRSNGRLMIDMVVNDKPGLVRTSGREGGLRMDMVRWEDQETQKIEREREQFLQVKD